MAEKVQAKEAFTVAGKDGRGRRVARRQILNRSDPAVKGREHLFVDLDGNPLKKRAKKVKSETGSGD